MGHSKGHPWTKDEDDQLLAFLEAGLSASQIAVKVGHSRNAVIGRISRAKRLRDHGFNFKQGQKIAEKRAEMVCEEVTETVSETVPERKGIQLVDLTERTCKFPVEFDVEAIGHWWFCGHPKTPDTTYCTKHARIANPTGVTYVKAG